MSPVSKAHMQASRRYNEKAYDRIELKVPKGRKAELQEHAQQGGESLNGLVNRAIEETVRRDLGERAAAGGEGSAGEDTPAQG